jgi:hypothetical protein
MRKALLLCAVVLILAVTISLPQIDITGLFAKVTSTFMTVVRAVVKEVLAAISNAL